jgi:Restriction endonuclease
MNLRSSAARRLVRCGGWSLAWLLFAPLSYLLWAWFVASERSHVSGPLLLNSLPPGARALAPYALPLACVSISAGFAWKALKLLGSAPAGRNDDEDEWIRRLGWLQFEQPVESHFTHRGLRTVLLRGEPGYLPRLSTVDASGAMALIHYTPWKTVDVGYAVVQSLVDEIDARSAQSGQLLTFGRLTCGSASLASAHHIEVICGERLIRVLRASGWDASRFRESGTNTGFCNSRSPDSGGHR